LLKEFEMLKGLGNIAQLMKQAGEMQGRMSEMKENLGKIQVEGTAGGGMVTVKATGHQKILTINIDPSVLDDQEMLEDLFIAAVNSALYKAKTAAAEEMQGIAGNMEIPGLSDALSKMGLGGAPGASE
jgi:DNA-binding YbaB/EbfC family protein